ncbi:putative oxidoreductase YfjR [Colletotrichum spaethianum]|uniref:Oxidoreductase YfjR n=1 Tax=Colletotrichum spaethianum TaxID=700344 RepID=A0AA37LFL7_9PEZI|nr:putative oxidoreductase YfjR [Colletotrichum spaethianum]GKT43287.1 putative oxidoreductase YfjR [Colletotrichum spaethianum]
MPQSDQDTVNYSDSDTIVRVLKDAVVGRLIHHPDRSFALQVELDLVKGASFFDKKPPLHFHLQEEYIEAVRGKLAVEIEGKEIVLTPADGRFSIKPYVNHRSYPLPISEQDDGNTKVAFLLSGEKTDNVFELNPVFFENWYKYQDEVVVKGAKIDLIQLFCTFDAGGTYVSFPSWVPFGQYVSLGLGVVVGRWIGSGLLGYQPFYRKWTTDWDLACQRMQQTIFQRRFADRTKTD